MNLLLSLLLLAAAPDLGQATDQLFHRSDVKGAAEVVDRFLQQHPDDPQALELGVIAHAARGSTARVNELAVQRAARGDPRALPILLFALQHAHTPHDDAVRLLAVSKKILPSLSAEQAVPLRREVGRLERTLGQFETAPEDAKLPGQITDWQVIGPFDNDQNFGFDAVYPPELKVDLSGTYAGKTREVRWRPLETPNWDGTVCLSCAQSPSKWVVSYLATWVKTPRNTDAALWASADDHLKVWVNGRLAASDDNSRHIADGQVRAGVRLHSGWNLILLKIAQSDDEWAAGLRVTDLRGEALEELSVSSKAHPTTPAGLSEHWPKSPEDPILAMLSSDHRALTSYLRAWRLYDLGRAREARLAFEALEVPGESCALCLEGIARSAQEDEDRDRALTALGQAIALDQGFATAAIERARIHLRMGLDKQAATEAEAARKSNPRAPEAMELLGELNKKHGFDPEAIRLMKAAEAVLPGQAHDVAVRAALASQAEDLPVAESLLRTGLAYDPSDWECTVALFNLLKGEGRLGEAASLFKAWVTHNPALRDPRQALASILANAHRDEDALAELAELRRMDPYDSFPDRLEGDLDNRRDDREGAAAAYRRALALDPGDWGLRNHVEIFEQGADVAGNYQVSEAEVRQRAAKVKPSDIPGANAVVLLREVTLIAHDDGSIRRREHFAVKVFDQAGIDRYLNFNVGNPPNLILEMAATIDKDGAPHEVSSIDNGQVHFPEPKPGSVFEIIYHSDSWPTSGSDWWQDFEFQEMQPALEQRWIVLQPKGKSLRTWKRGNLIDEHHESTPSAEVTLFDARDEPALAEEPDHPPFVSFRDLAVVSTFRDWDAVNRWVRASVDDQLALDTEDPEIKALARKLTAGAKTADQKVAALAGFVRNEIHYNQADTNIYRWRAHPARGIVETHYGDCKDKATLFEALARNAGLEVEHAVLLVNHEGETPTEIPTQWFDHAVAYLPSQLGLTHPGLLDLTASDTSVAVVPFMDQDVNAMIFRPGEPGYRLERIPFSGPEGAQWHIDVSLNLEAAGVANGTVRMRALGLSAHGARAGYRSAEGRGAFLDAMTSIALFGANRAGKEAISGLDDPENPFEIRVNFEAQNLLRQVGAQTLFKILEVGDLGDLDFSDSQQAERRQPLRIGPKDEVFVHREITLPKDLVLERLPEVIHLDNSFYAFDLTAQERDTRTIIIDTRYIRKVAEIPASEFPAFRKAGSELQQAVDINVILKAAAKPKLSDR